MLWPIQLLRIFTNAVFTWLFMPFLGILFTTLNCTYFGETVPYLTEFEEKIECWGSVAASYGWLCFKGAHTSVDTQ